MYNHSLYGNFRNPIFTEVWGTFQEFLDEVKECPLPIYIEAVGQIPEKWLVSEANLQTLYYLLYAKYGNSVVAASDINRFKFGVFSIIFRFGPTWQRELEVQETLRNMSEADLLLSSKEIYNHSFNPSSAPSTSSLTELDTINEQNTTNRKRSKLDAYDYLISLLKQDVTGTILEKFKPLFLQVVYPEAPLWYVTEIDETSEEEDDD